MASRNLFLAVVLLSLAAAGCGGAMAGKEPGSLEPQAATAVAAALAPSLVRVEYTLRYDNGEAPGTREQFLRDERPLEAAGFLLSPTQVMTQDQQILPRFIAAVAVRQGEDLVKASPVAYVKKQGAVVLELERPLKSGKPLVFDPKKKPPYQAVTYLEQDDGAWAVSVQPFSPGFGLLETGEKVTALGETVPCLLTDKAGVPVGLAMEAELPLDNLWMGPPLAWPTFAAAERDRLLADLQKRCAQAMVHVALHFRSPAKDVRRFHSREDEENVTENHVLGIALEGRRLLVLANLKPKDTARLERIIVHPAEGDPVEAKFAGSLRDYGCLVATLDKPLAASVAFSPMPIEGSRSALILVAEIRLHGDNRRTDLTHGYMGPYMLGWRRQIYFNVMGRCEGTFLFDTSGALVAAPVARRPTVAERGRDASREEPLLTPAVYLKNVLADLAKNVDPQNAPLSEADEQRLAWLGVELQGLNKDLARENKVSQLTRDGEAGAVVSYVYPDSPAAKAGVEPGWILLRVQVEGQTKPLELEIGEDEGDRGPFPWERLDELQEQYYDRIPHPWPAAENAFTRALTDLGFGKKFQAEFFHQGKVIPKDFVVAASPPHYDSAPRYKAPALGLTVRDLTYEVRRYFQKTAGDPGVIVSKIEPGSRASVGGIKPFEIVTHVNDKPILNIKDFEAAVPKGGEVRFSIKRMNQGREVKINLSAPAPPPRKPAAKPGDELDEP
jgi:S1-C subfamily serine protease